jgi:hypothetical protein
LLQRVAQLVFSGVARQPLDVARRHGRKVDRIREGSLAKRSMHCAVIVLTRYRLRFHRGTIAGNPTGVSTEQTFLERTFLGRESEILRNPHRGCPMEGCADGFRSSALDVEC